MAHIERHYENAIKIIDSRQRQSRPSKTPSTTNASLQKTSAPGSSRTPDLRGTPSIQGMADWLRMLGHSDDEINGLNIIHIAGTKGKGSTCAFTESFLRSHGRRTNFPRKTGMYTSPHLLVPEERIRIDSHPLSRELFAQYFFEVYGKLPQLATPYDSGKHIMDRGPRFLQLYALLAFHVFVREKVDVAIIETHSGGEYDATNVITKPVVTAITSLGMDHVQMLGPSIRDIAWHKAGIFKAGAVALSTIQDWGPTEVLVERAGKVGTEVVFVDEDAQLPTGAMQLKPSVQKKNATLAIAAANALLDRKAPAEPRHLTDQDIQQGVRQWHWPGRFETIPDTSSRMIWCLDAAHNDMSVRIAASWFAETSMELEASATKILIFTHINELRDAISVLESLADALKFHRVDIAHAIFSSYAEMESDGERGSGADYEAFGRVWARFHPSSTVWQEASIRRAIDRARSLVELRGESGDGAHVLVTGSQHLVGPALRIVKGK